MELQKILSLSPYNRNRCVLYCVPFLYINASFLSFCLLSPYEFRFCFIIMSTVLFRIIPIFDIVDRVSIQLVFTITASRMTI
jgi:hypothetical protein